jgi:hypothetical protein
MERTSGTCFVGGKRQGWVTVSETIFDLGWSPADYPPVLHAGDIAFSGNAAIDSVHVITGTGNDRKDVYESYCR